MEAQVILVEVTPRRDGATTTLRLAGGGATVPYRYGGSSWQAGIKGFPTIVTALDFDGKDMGGGGIPQAADLQWAPSSRAALADAARLFWAAAPISIRIGPEGEQLPPITLAGAVLDAPVRGGALVISLADPAAQLKQPILSDRFAGSGGLEGPVEFDGVLKSRAWGRCFNVVGRLLDRASNIWCFGDPGRPWQAFDAVRDKGVAAAAMVFLAWQGSAAATFAALQVAAAPAGGCVVCPSIACVKWWDEPAGDLRADIRGETAGGYVETAAEIAERIVDTRAAMLAGTVASARQLRPAVFGWRVDSDGTTVADALSEMLGDVSTSWVMVGDQLMLLPWTWGPPAAAARSQSVDRRETFKPVATRRLGYRRNWSPMARADLAGVVLAQDVAFADGTTVEELKPATPGATAGAPEGTTIGGTIDPVTRQVTGGRPAASVIEDIDRALVTIDQALADIDILTPSLFDLAKLAGTINAIMQAKTTLEGQAIGTVVRDVRTIADSAVEELHLIGARNGDGTGFIFDLDTVQVDGATSLAQRFEQLETHADDTASAVSTALSQAIADEASARATQIGTVQTQFGGDIEAATQSITSAYSDADSALSERIDQGQASLGALSSAFTSHQTASTDADTALASQLDQVQAQFGQDVATVAQAASTALSQAIADEASARSAQIDTAQTQFGANIEAATQSITSAYSAADTALSERIDQGETALGNLSSAFSTHQTASTDADQALGEQIEQVQASLGGDGGLVAKVSFLQSALVTTAGDVVAKAVLTLKANGRVGGIVATNDGAAATLDLDFDATRYFKPDGTLLLRVGSVESGEDPNAVYIPDAVVDRLRVNTAAIPVSASASSTLISSGSPLTVLSTAIVLPVEGWVQAQFACKQDFTDGISARSWNCNLLINGESVFTTSGLRPGDSVALLGATLCAAGTVTVSVVWTADGSIHMQNRTLFATAFPRTQ